YSLGNPRVIKEQTWTVNYQFYSSLNRAKRFCNSIPSAIKHSKSVITYKHRLQVFLSGFCLLTSTGIINITSFYNFVTIVF
ncbi:hypothetical protein TSAR_007218, partial [Trichomalopsis sarcophagae]